MQWDAEVSAIEVTVNIIFERLYLVSGLRNIALFFTMPLAPTLPPLGFNSIFVQVASQLIFPTVRQVI